MIVKNISALLASVVALFVLSAPLTVSAAAITQESCKGVTSGVCSDAQLAERNPSSNPLVGKDGIITKTVSLLGFVVGVLAVIILIVTGIRFAISGSNPQEVTKARNGVIYAVVGIILAVMAQTIVQFILVKL